MARRMVSPRPALNRRRWTREGPNLRVCCHLCTTGWHTQGEKGRIDVLPWYRLVGVVSTSSETQGGKTELPCKGEWSPRGTETSVLSYLGMRPGRFPGVVTHSRPLRATAGSRVGTRTTWPVATDWVTGSYSSAIKAGRRLNVQSGPRKGRVNKSCGHQARAWPSVIVGTEKVSAASGWARRAWLSSGVDARFGRKCGHTEVGRVRSESLKTMIRRVRFTKATQRHANIRENRDPSLGKIQSQSSSSAQSLR